MTSPLSTQVITTCRFHVPGVCCSSEVKLIDSALYGHPIISPHLSDISVNVPTKILSVDFYGDEEAISDYKRLIPVLLNKKFNMRASVMESPSLGLSRQTVRPAHHKFSINSAIHKLITSSPLLAIGVFIWSMCLTMSIISPVTDHLVFSQIGPIIVLILLCPSMFKKAIHSVKHGNIDINVLMSLSICGAVFLSDYLEASSVTSLFSLSDFFQSIACASSNESIHTLLSSVPQVANRVIMEGSDEMAEDSKVDATQDVKKSNCCSKTNSGCSKSNTLNTQEAKKSTCCSKKESACSKSNTTNTQDVKKSNCCTKKDSSCSKSNTTNTQDAKKSNCCSKKDSACSKSNTTITQDAKKSTCCSKKDSACDKSNTTKTQEAQKSNCCSKDTACSKTVETTSINIQDGTTTTTCCTKDTGCKKSASDQTSAGNLSKKYDTQIDADAETCCSATSRKIKNVIDNTYILNYQTETIPVESILSGDKLLIRQGEIIPIDGHVLYGNSFVNEASITGESRPILKSFGSQVLAGSINGDSTSIVVEASSVFSDSKLSHIIDIISNDDYKSKTETTINKFAKIYTPIVIMIAVFISILWPIFLEFDGYDNINFSKYLYTGIVILVISCPCALVISVPIAYLCALTRASKHGAFVKGGSYIDILSNISDLCIDKTGTLTNGRFTVTRWKETEIPEYLTSTDVKNIILQVEKLSNHFIAKSVCSYLSSQNTTSGIVDIIGVENYLNIPGEGISATVKIQQKNDTILPIDILIGNSLLLFNHNVNCNVQDSTIYVSFNSVVVIEFELADEIKHLEVSEFLEFSKEAQIQLHLLSGDSVENVLKFLSLPTNRLMKQDSYKNLKIQDKNTNVDIEQPLLNNSSNSVDTIASFFKSVRGNCYPNDKVNFVRNLVDKHNIVGMIGDGVNDAPALKTAHVGITVDNATGISEYAADICLVNAGLHCLKEAIDTSKRCRRVILFNIYLVLFLKALMMGLVCIGLPSLWGAVLTDVGGMVLVCLNSSRLV